MTSFAITGVHPSSESEDLTVYGTVTEFSRCSNFATLESVCRADLPRSWVRDCDCFGVPLLLVHTCFCCTDCCILSCPTSLAFVFGCTPGPPPAGVCVKCPVPSSLSFACLLPSIRSWCPLPSSLPACVVGPSPRPCPNPRAWALVSLPLKHSGCRTPCLPHASLQGNQLCLS